MAELVAVGTFIDEIISVARTRLSDSLIGTISVSEIGEIAA
jgi:hypothetical protein